LRKLLFTFLLCGAAQIVAAQQPNYLFHRLGVKDGLFEETVHAVQQDAKGFLWLNFRTLIQRYDGYRMLNFYPGNQLPEGNIRAMAMDKKNRLWLVSGDASLGYLDPDNFKYHPVKINIPKGYNRIITGAYLNKQNEMMLLWGKDGFMMYSDHTKMADTSNNPFQLPAGWTPIHVWQDDELNYWIGTVNGLVKYNSGKKTLSYRGHNEDNDPAIKAFEQVKNINSVYRDRSNNFWAITWEGGLKILCYNSNTGKQTDWVSKINSGLKKYYVPFGFMETSGNELWLSGMNLFCKINTADETVQVIPQQPTAEFSMLYDQIFSLFEDREKNIWVATNKGLFRFNPMGQLFTILSNRPVGSPAIETETTDFLETSDGKLLVSTWGSGIFPYQQPLKTLIPARTTLQHQTAGTMVWSMVQRSNGDLWCGMQNGELFIVEAATQWLIKESPEEAAGKTIRQLALDKNGNIWMGTAAGAVLQWDAAQRKYSKFLQADALISRLYVDAQNRVWVGTDRDGLYCLNGTDGKLLQHYTSTDPPNKKLMINGVADILQYNDSIFYIAGNGLNILNTRTNQFQYYTVAKGLHSANISNLLKDKNGYIWMTSGSGIMSYHPGKKRLSLYDAKDGVPSYNFNAGAAAVLKNGQVLFGTNKDFLLFNPEELTSRIYSPPKVHFTTIEIMGEQGNADSLARLSIIKLKPHQNSFRVVVSTLYYKDLYAMHYMLEGIDKGWKRADNDGTIEYNYLPPGKYTLKLTCFREDGTPGEITSLPLLIAAPFYRTWWFYTLMALLAGALLFWFDRQRIKRREAVHKMRTDIAGNLHQEVNTALQNINILSEMARIKADKDIDKSKEFIEQIHGKSQTMMTAMDDMLWSIDPVNDTMEKTILRMQEFIDSLSNRQEALISLLVDQRVKKLNLNMQLRHDAFILFRESLRHIVAAGVRDCKVHLATEKNNLLFTVQCSNTGANMQQLNNLLHSIDMEQRIKNINGTLDTAIHKSNTVLMVKVPV